MIYGYCRDLIHQAHLFDYINKLNSFNFSYVCTWFFFCRGLIYQTHLFSSLSFSYFPMWRKGGQLTEYMKNGINKLYRKLLTLQSSQPLLRIFNLSNTRICVFPEVEEFFVVLYGFYLPNHH